MKLSKKKEAAMLKVYKSYWDGYLSGDVSGMAKLLDNNYTQIGSAEAEVFSTKKDAVKFLHDTIDQVAGNAKIRNRSIKLEYLEDYILVNDLFDIYVLTDDKWVYYAKLRASTLMYEVKGKWKFIHQHSSVPDIRTADGENLATDKIAAENIQLRDAIKRRTIELEQKNRELKIETALERIRTRTTAMQHSDELSKVAVLLYEELSSLGFSSFINCGYVEVDQENSIQRIWMSSPKGKEMQKANLPLTGDPVMNKRFQAWKKQESLFHQKVSGKKLQNHKEFVKAYYRSEEMDKMVKTQFPDTVIFYCANFSHGYLHLVSETALTQEEEALIVRFTQVFKMTYTRFLDLQKAEEQAREAQIEVALERIRAASLAMHESNELLNVIKVISNQLEKLAIQFNHVSFGQNNSLEDYKFWTSIRGLEEPFMVHIPYINHPMIERLKKARKDKVSLFADSLSIKQHSRWNEHMFKHQAFSMLSNEQKEKLLNLPFDRSIAILPNIFLVIANNSGKSYSDKENKIITRVGEVFEQAYTRFLDLQKAEKQAREAQIEAALERIRARALAMHSSTELMEVAQVLREQMGSLGQSELVGSVVHLYPENSESIKSAYSFTTDNKRGKIVTGTVEFPKNATSLTRKWLKMYNSDKDEYTIKTSGTELKEWIKVRNAKIPFFAKHKISKQPTVAFYHVSDFSGGSLLMTTHEEPSNEANELQRRAADVFDLAYRRFLDLQNAEMQAREAQIEAALERVRSKTMAMHNSHDVGVTVVTLFDEVIKLGLDKSIRCGIGILEGTEGMETWSAASSSTGKVDLKMGMLDMTIHPMLVGLKKAWKKGETGYSYDYIGKDVRRYYNALNNEPEYPFFVELDTLPDKEFHNSFFFSEGILFAFTVNPLSEEAAKVLNRFAHVFGQTYRRFLDLQQAEAQAREAQIEAALERVRSRSMAMHSSEELEHVIQVVYEQFVHLDIHIEHTGFIMDYKANDDMNIWLADQQGVPSQVTIPYFDSEYWNSFIKAKEKGIDFFANKLTFAEKNRFYRKLLKFIPGLPEKAKEFYLTCPGLAISTVLLENVGLYIENFSGIPYSDEENKILMRFGKVFQQTYTRFLDLHKSEEQTREAQIEAALERVRARALAMQEPEELKEVAQVLRHEMGALGVEELETCSIYINDEQAHKAECWYALKDLRKRKKQLISDQFALDLNDTWVGRKMLKFYNTSDEKTSIVMKGKNRIEWIRYCEKKSVPFRGYYGDVIPDRTYQLYKFSHGAIGAATAGDISPEHWGLLQRASTVFTLAYSRFKDLSQALLDLKKLKEAKLKAENALTELKSTQSQLVHAEKMASLGELTAGIAHEIQNPLNFVNNFSEVSRELVEEINEEIKAGNLDEVKFITTDLEQNLEKINHHGQRASGIVKGMLEHSRTGSSKKELTDINKLADEYLRLSYHGLRAKEKSFNADFKSDFDETLPQVKVIAQDLGRVILNLINNAFYAVSEKTKADDTEYKPVVVVSTRKLNAAIEIIVRDNGYGIPKEIVDKIFQPFFTTKPSGSGTGLGLSMSYDIITKGHGGELKVNTVEGVGTEFLITLPY